MKSSCRRLSDLGSYCVNIGKMYWVEALVCCVVFALFASGLGVVLFGLGLDHSRLELAAIKIGGLAFASVLLACFIVGLLRCFCGRSGTGTIGQNDIVLQWQSLVREAPALIAVLSREGKVVFINRRVPQTELFLQAEIATFLSFDATEKEKLRGVIGRVFDNRESVRYESRIVLLDGKEVFFDNSAGPVIKDGKVQAVIFVAIDITERKNFEQQSLLLSRALEQSPLSIVITDADGKIEYANPFFTELSGYTLDEVRGLSPAILKSGRTREEKYVDLWQTIKAGKIWRGVFHNRKKNGDLYSEFSSVAPVVDEYGKVKHFIAVKEDVTERMRIETALKESEQKLSELINAMPSPLFYNDLDGVCQGCNQALMDFLGLNREAIIGKKLFDLASRDLAEEFSLSGSALSQGGECLVASCIRHADGQDRDVAVYKSRLTSSDGGVYGTVAVIMDVSELKRTEKHLRKNEADLRQAMQDLKSYNSDLVKTQDQLVQSEKLAAIGFLAAGVAHEINNPLAFIYANLASLDGYVNILLEALEAAHLLKDELDRGNAQGIAVARQRLASVESGNDINVVLGDIHALLGETKEGVERIKFIVQDLRRFSRTDSSQMAPASVHDILDGIINIAWNELKYKVELVKAFGDVPFVMCNVQQLGQVFLNILVNASQAIKDKGVITITTYTRDTQVCVDIHDTGEGIPKENWSKLFDPFFTTKLPGQGTGLGLSVSYEIMKKHGGSIEFNSTLEAGTTFTVILSPALESVA